MLGADHSPLRIIKTKPKRNPASFPLCSQVIAQYSAPARASNTFYLFKTIPRDITNTSCVVYGGIRTYERTPPTPIPDPVTMPKRPARSSTIPMAPSHDIIDWGPTDMNEGFPSSYVQRHQLPRPPPGLALKESCGPPITSIEFCWRMYHTPYLE